MFRESLLVKRRDERRERFSIDTGRGFLRRGPDSYAATCTPASFPLEPRDVVVEMFVGLYAFKCEAGLVPPHPDARSCPCRASAT